MKLNDRSYDNLVSVLAAALITRQSKIFCGVACEALSMSACLRVSLSYVSLLEDFSTRFL
jgi:hypothetical protein